MEKVSLEISNNDSIYNDNPVMKSEKKKSPEGTFNGYSITYETVEEEEIFSQVHCVGESYEPMFYHARSKTKMDLSWEHRSCHFQFFCFDIQEKKYVIFQNPKEKDNINFAFPQNSDVQQSYLTDKTPSGLPYGVAIGSINQKWTHTGIIRLKWYPEIRNIPPSNFYALPADVVMIPFHSLASFNPGHLVWDDFLPIFTLMKIFHFDKHRLLAMRYILEGDGLWASCDWRQSRTDDCTFMLKKFGTLMVSEPDKILPFSTNQSPRLILSHGSAKPKTNLVCAKNGLAGLGALSDHGTKKGHGWETKDYELVHNHGRGGQLWKFRNYMINNLGISVTDAPPSIDPIKIVFSERSSKGANRNYNFGVYIKALEAADLGPNVVFERYQLSKLSLKEQVEIMRDAAIFVTACGGGAVTASFLPRSATAIIFYGHDSGMLNGRDNGTPARLDFDYFNNMAYIRTHWIGMTRRDIYRMKKDDRNAKEKENTLLNKRREDVEMFVSLVKHDLNIIRRERVDYDSRQNKQTH